MASRRFVVFVAALATLGVTPHRSPLPPVTPQALSASLILADLDRAGREMSTLADHGMAFQELTDRVASQLQSLHPDAPETVDVLLRAQRMHEALAVAHAIVDRGPSRVAEVVDIVRKHAFALSRDDERRPHKEILRALLTLARTRASSLPPEEAARVALAVLLAEPQTGRAPQSAQATRFREFAAQYAGTNAAAEAEALGASVEFSGDGQALRSTLDAISAAQPGTCADLLARTLRVQSLSRGGSRERPGQDPTERFLEALTLARGLDRSSYPACASGPERPDTAVPMLFAYQPSYAPANVDRLLEAYRDLVIRRFSVSESNPTGHGIGWIVTDRMGELFALKGDRRGGIERTFDELERTVADAPGVRYLRADYYATRARRGESPEERDWFAGKARVALASVAGDASSPYRSRALASLGVFHQSHGEFREAIARFRQYLAAEPRSPAGWIAQLRIGQCFEGQSSWALAAEAFADVAADRSGLQMSRVLGFVSAGRAWEAANRPDLALSAYREALEAWPAVASPSIYGSGIAAPSYDLPAVFVRTDAPREWSAPFSARTRVERRVLASRADRMSAALAAPGGTGLEHARWLLEHARRDEARRAAADVLAAHPRSANAAGARAVANMARVLDAIARAGAGSPGADDAVALRVLDDVARQPFDFSVCAAQIAATVVRARRTGPDATKQEAVLINALERWRRFAAAQPAGAANTDLERDVAAIHTLLFRPEGGSLYSGSRWNGFQWPSPPPRFVVIHPEITVVLSDRRLLHVRVPAVPADRALVFDGEQTEFLATVIRTLGGTATKSSWLVMAPPVQPTGGSIAVMRFLARAFPLMPGHWAGWEFYTFPVIGGIEFFDTTRTRARVHLVIGYSGGEALIERHGDAWRVVTLSPTWVM